MNTNRFVLSLLLSSSLAAAPGLASAKTLEEYRPLYSLDAQGKKVLQASSVKRLANLRKALGNEARRAQVPTRGLISTPRNETSSLYLKSLLSRVSGSYRNFESYGKPLTFDPSLFQSEVNQRVKNQKHLMCLNSLGVAPTNANRSIDKNAPARELLINQIYALSKATAENRKNQLANEVKNGYRSETSQAIENYIRQSGHGDILTKLGPIYQIEAIDGKVNRIRMTRFVGTKGYPHIILPDAYSITLSTELLSTVISGYDQYFLMGSECLSEMVKHELEQAEASHQNIVTDWKYKYTGWASQTAKQIQSRIAKLRPTLQFLNQKLAGARYANQMISNLTKAERHFLLDLFIQLRDQDIPTGLDHAELTKIAAKQQGVVRAGSTANPLTLDQVYYANLEEELFRVEEYIREFVRMNQVNQSIIQKIQSEPKR